VRAWAEELLARGQQAHSLRGPLEQRDAELTLEVADLPAERRLRDVQPPRGATDVLLLGDGDEVVDLREAHPGILRGPRRAWADQIGIEPGEPLAQWGEARS
jgi:hypothetical protein